MIDVLDVHGIFWEWVLVLGGLEVCGPATSRHPVGVVWEVVMGWGWANEGVEGAGGVGWLGIVL